MFANGKAKSTKIMYFWLNFIFQLLRFLRLRIICFNIKLALAKQQNFMRCILEIVLKSNNWHYYSFNIKSSLNI